MKDKLNNVPDVRIIILISLYFIWKRICLLGSTKKWDKIEAAQYYCDRAPAYSVPTSLLSNIRVTFQKHGVFLQRLLQEKQLFFL